MRPVSVLPFQELHTPRLRLRGLVPGDAKALFELRADEQIMRYIGRPRTATVDDAAALIQRKMTDLRDGTAITWGITLHNDDTLIGTVGFYRLKVEHFRGEVGYLLSPAHWRRGLMGEALEAVVAHGFDTIRFHSIEAVTDPRNAASNRLLERHGFIREGMFRESFFWEGAFLDSAVYSRLAPAR